MLTFILLLITIGIGAVIVRTVIVPRAYNLGVEAGLEYDKRNWTPGAVAPSTVQDAHFKWKNGIRDLTLDKDEQKAYDRQMNQARQIRAGMFKNRGYDEFN